MATMSIRIDEELNQRLQNLADATGRPKSWYLKQALEKYLEHEEWMTQAVHETLGREDRREAAYVGDDDVAAWLESWGTPRERRPPKPK